LRYPPFTSLLGDKHGEARWTLYRLAVHHPSERVKTSDNDSVVVDDDSTPLVNGILIAGSFCG
jgi:hypothetical protein